MVVLVGTKKAVAIAVRNNKPQKRYTNLKTRLKGTGDDNQKRVGKEQHENRQT